MRYRYSAGEDGKPVKKAVIYTCDEHGINFADVDSEAVSIVKRLKASGFDTYIVGGAVRDLILGKKPKDFDIVSAASPTRIKKIFRNSRIIGRRFRLVHVYFGQRIFEVSTFRSLRDGPTSNTFGKIEEDVLRRDFTLNALFYDPEQQIVVDYVDGIKDIKKRLINPIIPISEIFTDDPVRMIRAVKYAAATGFSLPMNLKMKIQKQSNLLASISPSRLTEEIFKIVHSDKAADIVDLLDKMGLYSYLQPEAAELMRKDANFRKNYLQSMAALKGIESQRGQALGALFRDYLESSSEWKSGAIENFKEIFRTARAFVLPMNPPRYDMEYALKKFLSSHGITIKRVNIIEKLKTAGEDSAPSKRKRRRRKPRKKDQTPTQ
ncbi:MAG: polynucleotide adenylyltransferase PcnB [Treponema sp.]|jgi:poly(A) polymerase|nr:polynucleotide adenylyltransferase PcnB [Treponema sp.]